MNYSNVYSRSRHFLFQLKKDIIRMATAGLIELAKKKPVDYTLANATKSEIKFQLFTSKFCNGICLTEENAQQINIKVNIPTKFFIHGWNSNLQGNWYNAFKDEYFTNGDYNIIYVDWFIPGSKEYQISAANVKPVGHYIADFIIASKINLEKIHLIGKSLGAHVASWTGKQIYKLTNKKVNRITALDPASPKFENATLPETDRLNKTDADFVDVVHTDVGYYGFEQAIGTVDFYPNGGGIQPGCTSDDAGHNDSHGRSNWYYLESINSTNIKAVKANSWEDFLKGDFGKDESIDFGENVSMSAEGV
ncbi:hydrolase, partial [Oryctes borbonicus]